MSIVVRCALKLEVENSLILMVKIGFNEEWSIFKG